MGKDPGNHLTIPATDGLPLAGTLFRAGRVGGPGVSPGARGAILIAGAVGRARGAYTDLADYLARSGWDAVTFDYRGIGGSWVPWDRAASFTMLDWGEKDLAGVIAWARRRLEPRRLVLLGHSIGGQVAPFAPNIDALDALVGVAAQRGYWEYWPGLRKYAVYLFFRVYVPLCLKVRGFLPLGAVDLEGLPHGAACDWARWGLGREYRDADGNRLRPRFARFTAPVLAIGFDDDLSLAPKRAVDVLFHEHYTAAPVTRWHIRPREVGARWLGHAGFFDPRVCPERLWRATLDWIESRETATPSSRTECPDELEETLA